MKASLISSALPYRLPLLLSLAVTAALACHVFGRCGLRTALDGAVACLELVLAGVGCFLLSRRCLGRLLERRKDGQPAPEEPQESALPEEAEEAPLPESVPWMLDVRGSCLRRGGKTVIGLSRQQAFLLRLFLEAETRPLSVLSIGLSLWPQDADAYALQDRTYTLVCRLRSSLHAAGMEIVKEQDGYRLYGNLALAE